MVDPCGVEDRDQARHQGNRVAVAFRRRVRQCEDRARQHRSADADRSVGSARSRVIREERRELYVGRTVDDESHMPAIRQRCGNQHRLLERSAVEHVGGDQRYRLRQIVGNRDANAARHQNKRKQN